MKSLEQYYPRSVAKEYIKNNWTCQLNILNKINLLLKTEFWLLDIKLKMQNVHTLIVDIPCTRWNEECRQQYHITPNKIKDMIKNKLNQQLDIIMIF